MKISKLHIDSYRHLENLDFDFTYQSGARKGQPLEKICFIGQSATGKTGLLELIYECNQYLINLEVVNGRSIFDRSATIKHLKGDFSFKVSENDNIKYEENQIVYKEKLYINNNEGGSVTSLILLKLD